VNYLFYSVLKCHFTGAVLIDDKCDIVYVQVYWTWWI